MPAANANSSLNTSALREVRTAITAAHATVAIHTYPLRPIVAKGDSSKWAHPTSTMSDSKTGMHGSSTRAIALRALRMVDGAPGIPSRQPALSDILRSVASITYEASSLERMTGQYHVPSMSGATGERDILPQRGTSPFRSGAGCSRTGGRYPRRPARSSRRPRIR